MTGLAIGQRRPQPTPQPRSRALGVAALLLACASAITAVHADGPDPLQEHAEQLERVRDRIAALNQSIEQDRARRDALQSALENAEKSVAAAATEVQRLAAQVETQAARTRQAQLQLGGAQHKLQQERDALAAQVRAAFKIGANGRAALVLGDADPGLTSRLLGYYDALGRARLQHIAGVQAQVQALDAQQRHYQDALRALQALQDQRREAFTQLQLRRGEREAAIAQLAQKLDSESAELKQQQTNEKQVQALIEQLKRALAEAPLEAVDGRPFAQQKGRLGWPLRGPILADYGSAKGEGHLQWKGLWIGAPEGAPVRACARGRVAYVGWMSRYGLIVVVEHDGGYFSLYGHANSVAKAAGDAVAAGDVIATSGDTGGYEQPGLYFEIRKGTEPLDPKQWLRRPGAE